VDALDNVADGMTLLQHRVALLCAVLLAGVLIVGGGALIGVFR